MRTFLLKTGMIIFMLVFSQNIFADKELAHRIVFEELHYEKNADKILFEEYGDLDKDGKIEAILLCNNPEGGIGDNLLLIKFLGKEKYTLQAKMDCTDHGFTWGSLVKIKGFQNRMLLLEDLSGKDFYKFALYNITEEGLITYYDSLEEVFDEPIKIVDRDQDGEYDAIVVGKENLKTIELPISIK